MARQPSDAPEPENRAAAVELVEEVLELRAAKPDALREKQARLPKVLAGGLIESPIRPRAEPAGPNPQQPLVDGNIAWFRRQGMMPDEPDDKC